MKKSKVLASVLVVMLLASMSGVSAFAEELVPLVEEPPAVEEPVVEEPVAEVEVSYLRFDIGSDLVFVAEDGIIVSVTTELDLHPEEPEVPVEEPQEPAEEPEVPVEEPEVPVEEPQVPVEEPQEPAEEPQVPAEEPQEPADPYADYLGLSVTEGIDLLLNGYEFENPVELDIFANGETANELMIMLEEDYADQLKLKTVALDSDSQNAERFINAAIYRITPGKMNLLEKLAAQSNEVIDYAELAKWDVKDIQGLTNSKRRETKSEVQSGASKRVKTNNDKVKGKSK